MKTMTIADFKANFSLVVEELKKGNEVVVTYGRSKVPLATMVPQSKMNVPGHSIVIGDLQAAGWTHKLTNFDMTEDELLNK